MNFAEFHQTIHQHNFQILVLNDYRLKGKMYTFIAVQDKEGHGFQAEGPSNQIDKIYQELITKINSI